MLGRAMFASWDLSSASTLHQIFRDPVPIPCHFGNALKFRSDSDDVDHAVALPARASSAAVVPVTSRRKLIALSGNSRTTCSKLRQKSSFRPRP